MTVGTILSGKKHELLPTAKPKKSKSKKDRKGICVSAVFVSLSILKVHKNCYAVVESEMMHPKILSLSSNPTPNARE